MRPNSFKWIDPDRGLTDGELLAACAPPSPRVFDMNKQLPNALDDWSASLYSLSRCYRKLLAWPAHLPLPFTSDHGMMLNQRLEEHELKSVWSTHVSWCKPRVTMNGNHPTKKIVRVPHPWTTHRKANGWWPSAKREGVVMFVTHSHPWSDYIGFDWEGSVSYCNDQLKNRGLELRALCLHQHDVVKGLAERLRPLNLPIFTLGNTLNQLFVDRFYSTMTLFEGGVSARPGIESLYFCEMGLPFYALSKSPPELTRTGSHASKNTVANRLDHLGRALENELLNTLFIENDCSSMQRTDLAEKLLSSDLGDNASVDNLSSVFRASIAQERRNVLISYKEGASKLISKACTPPRKRL